MNKNILTVGLAIFAMFFGAGNITLPLLLTQSWPHEWPITLLGFCLSGVVVTFIGLIGGVLCRNTQTFFAPLGLVFGMAMQIVLISIEGPFGIVPRCLIVAFGGIKEIFPEVNSAYFYITSSIVLYFLAINRTRLVSIIGNYLTPLMFIALAVVITLAISQNGFKAFDKSFIISLEAFKDGVYKGYLTYDLPGAIYFTTIAMGYLSAIGSTKREMISNGLKASIISATLLIIVYAIFFYLGASYYDQIAHLPIEQILANIVKTSCGHSFAILFSVFLVLACLTTALAAVTIWSDFIYHFLKKYNINYKVILALSIILAAFVSSLKFEGLMKLLTPILTVVYPILLLLTVYNIITKRAEEK